LLSGWAFTEPHRGYELNSGVRLGKNLADVTVPALPAGHCRPCAAISLDYAIEVEWADAHDRSRAESASRPRASSTTRSVVITSRITACRFRM